MDDLTSLDGRLLVVSNLGMILSQQEDKAFSVMLCTPDIPWFGCDVLQGAVYLAGGKYGAYKLVENAVISIKSKGHMIAVKTIDNEVMFLLSNTRNSGFVRHSPFDGERWLLVKT